MLFDRDLADILLRLRMKGPAVLQGHFRANHLMRTGTILFKAGKVDTSQIAASWMVAAVVSMHVGRDWNLIVRFQGLRNADYGYLTGEW